MVISMPTSFIPCDLKYLVLVARSLVRLECHEQWAMLLMILKDKCWHKFFTISWSQLYKIVKFRESQQSYPNRINHKKQVLLSWSSSLGICPTLQGQKSQLETVRKVQQGESGGEKEKQQRALISCCSLLTCKVELGAGDGSSLNWIWCFISHIKFNSKRNFNNFDMDDNVRLSKQLLEIFCLNSAYHPVQLVEVA